MRRMTWGLVSMLAVVVIAGCGGLNREAGSEIDELALGTATARNTMAMTGQGPALQDLDARFQAEVPTMVTFAFDSDVLDPGARAVLDRQAAFIRRFPELRFSVFGHADRVGSPSYNQALGERRARSVIAYLARRGVSPDRLDALVSFGERRPLVPGAGAERANRRSVTRVNGFVASAPLVLDGRYAEIVYRGYVESAGRRLRTPAPATRQTIATGDVAS